MLIVRGVVWDIEFTLKVAHMAFQNQLSNEKNLGWLGYIGDYKSYPVI